MVEYKKEFIQFLENAGVLKFGDFTAKSGRKIPYFINAGDIKTGEQIKKLGEFYAKAYLDKLGKKKAVLYGPAYKGGELQLPGDGLGVVEEHFVKIAKAKEKYRVRILFFHLKILFHHRGKIRHCLLNQPFPFPGERRPSPCVSQWQPPQLAQLPPQEDASQVAGSSPSAHRLRMPVICCSKASNSFLASL